MSTEETTTTSEATTTTSTPSQTTSTTTGAVSSTTAPESETTTTPPQVDTGGAVQIVESNGIRVAAQPVWEVRIRQMDETESDEVTRPVVHLATVPLAAGRADFGGGVVEQLGPGDVFISLVEFGQEAANTALFAPVDEFPSVIDATRFHPKQLQRVIPGQAGQQVFFSYNDRPFCMYVVIGSAALAGELAVIASEMAASISIDAP